MADDLLGFLIGWEKAALGVALIALLLFGAAKTLAEIWLTPDPYEENPEPLPEDWLDKLIERVGRIADMFFSGAVIMLFLLALEAASRLLITGLIAPNL